MAEQHREKTSLRNALVAGATTDPAGPPGAGELSALLRHLEQHHAARSEMDRDGVGCEESLLSLGLGLASLDCDQLHLHSPHLLPQIALLGPTQAGKSSLVNALLRFELAEVSPLAGFTVHPHGFCWGPGTDETASALDTFFHPMQRVAAGALPRDRYDRYTLTDVSGMAILPPVPGACIWDTPDFDSVDSESYRSHVLRIAALADLVILVLSKDKYSDQSVWDMVSLLQPLGHPTVIVLNKIDERARTALVDSLEAKWRGIRADSFPLVVTVPFMDAEQAALPPSSIEDLARCIQRKLSLAGRNGRRQRSRELLERHWSVWLAPARAEQEARAEWQRAIDRSLEEALTCYQRDYLNHPHHYETFQRALARLLTLLEIPGVAGVVASTRRLLTWPFRQVSTVGRRLTGGTAESGAKSGEQGVLEQLKEHLLLYLQQMALAKREQESSNQVWWRDLALEVRTAQGEINAQMQSALDGYARSFQSEIDQTARELYQRLETRPVVLNSLRATRITTDAAALAFALHSGGIGIQDFVIAPATLSLTSMLAESALGRYVNRAAEDLKARQLAAVSALFRDTLGELLKALPDRLDDARHFKLSVAALERAERLLAVYG